jgi:protocatechuate 3,4-dioxygenase alpha subunit
VNASRKRVASGSQTVGPFFHFGLTIDASIGTLASADTPGVRMRLRVRVLDGDAMAVPDAMVEIYQADAAGAYPPPGGRLANGFTGFGRLATDAEGWCTFETVRPGAIADASGRAQAPHIDVCLFMRGLLRHLYTRVYFADDPGLATDPFLAVVPPDRRNTLTASSDSGDRSLWTFVIRLQGEPETVFFDL